MTDEELIALLRKADEYEPLGHDGWEAADRIEALVIENTVLRKTHTRVERLECVLMAIAGTSNFTSAEAMRAFAKSELKGADHE